MIANYKSSQKGRKRVIKETRKMIRVGKEMVFF